MCAAVLVALPTGCGSSKSSSSSSGAGASSGSQSGGGGSDEQTVRRVATEYDSALASGDFATACGDSSTKAKAALVAAVARAGVTSATDCPSALKAALSASPVATQVAKTIKLGAIHVTGNMATIDTTATVSGRTIATKAYAVKENGAWKVSSSQVGGG
jgi:hypothetical protein